MKNVKYKIFPLMCFSFSKAAQEESVDLASPAAEKFRNDMIDIIDEFSRGRFGDLNALRKKIERLRLKNSGLKKGIERLESENSRLKQERDRLKVLIAKMGNGMGRSRGADSICL